MESKHFVFLNWWRTCELLWEIQQTKTHSLSHWPVSTSAMSMKWSSEADANIFPSWLKLSVLTGQSSLWHIKWWLTKVLRVILSCQDTHQLTNRWHLNTRPISTSTDWPGEAAHTHQFVHVPQTDEGVGTSCGEVFPHGVELNADAVGRVSVDGLDGLQLWITANKHNIHFSLNLTSTRLYKNVSVGFFLHGIEERCDTNPNIFQFMLVIFDLVLQFLSALDKCLAALINV